MKKLKENTVNITKELLFKRSSHTPLDYILTFIGSFIGLAVIGLIQGTEFGEKEDVFFIGSFGASAVLIYGAPTHRFAQPRNLIGGHLICAVIGVTIHKILPNDLWLASSLSVALSIVAMQMTSTMHPPGGATALIAVLGTEKIKSVGYFFILSPVLSGVMILFIVALIVNNIPKGRRYPNKKI